MLHLFSFSCILIYTFVLGGDIYKIRLNVLNRYQRKVSIDYEQLHATEIQELAIDGGSSQIFDLFYHPLNNTRVLGIKLKAFDFYDRRKLLINNRHMIFVRASKVWKTTDVEVREERKLLQIVRRVVLFFQR